MEKEGVGLGSNDRGVRCAGIALDNGVAQPLNIMEGGFTRS